MQNILINVMNLLSTEIFQFRVFQGEFHDKMKIKGLRINEEIV